MAGTNPDFDAAAFRSGVRTAMQLGAPVKKSDRVTFIFKTQPSYPPGTRLDQEGRPLDPRIAPIVEASLTGPLQVDCALEFTDASAEELPVGNFRPTKAVVTVFDTDYERVKNAKEVLIGGDRYIVGYKPPPLALFNVGIHQFVCFAVDET